MSALPEPRPIEPDPEADAADAATPPDDKPREPSERDTLLEQIAAQREEALLKDAGNEPIIDDGQPDAPPEAKAKPAPPAEAQIAAQSEPVRIEDFSNHLVKIKVDGEERYVPLADVVRNHQKDAAATQRLAEANRLLDEAQQRAAAAPPPAAPEPAAAPAVDTEREFLNALYAGDEEKTTHALKQMLDGLKPAKADASPIDADAIARAVEQRLSLKSALTAFQAAYPDIVADPYLPRLADTFLMEETGNRRLEDLDPARVSVALETAGKRTRDWVTQRAAALPQAPSTTTRADKRSRKESIDEIPSVSLTSATAEPPAETPSQTIAAMARQRPGGHDF